MTGSPPGRTLRGVMSPRTMSPAGVIAVDHHEAFRRAARTSVSSAAGFEWLGEAASAEEAIEIAVALRPDLALVEMHMPGIDGLETARRLTRAIPGVVVVLVSADATPDEGEVVSSGAAAFLTKEEVTPSALRALWEQHGPD
jgi:two-component system, NarL family, invasion response regulator UvrY